MGNRGWKKRWSEGKRRLYCVLGSSAGCWALNSILKDLGTSDMPLSRSGEKILNWADPALDRSRRLGQGNLPWSDASSNSLKSTKTATLLQVVARATPQFWKNLLPSTSKLGIGTKYRPWRLPSAVCGGWCMFTSLMCLENSFWSGIRFRVFQICTQVFSDWRSASFLSAKWTNCFSGAQADERVYGYTLRRIWLMTLR